MSIFERDCAGIFGGLPILRTYPVFLEHNRKFHELSTAAIARAVKEQAQDGTGRTVVHFAPNGLTAKNAVFLDETAFWGIKGVCTDSLTDGGASTY